MSENRDQKLRRLFDAACEMAAQERDSYLAGECASDSSLRDELNLLLEVRDQSAGFLSSPALEAVLPQLADGASGASDPAPFPGGKIGGYTLKSILGEGGMGVVFEAEQESPRRRIALKVIRRGFASPGVLRRFRLEAELLARLQHPGIAQIYEAGTFIDGDGERPFIAMELVDGQPLTDYLEEKQLSTSEQLELMARICDGVHHAHQKGVIHRDLKPANILVDAEGRPKILDFGISAATDADLQLTTALTQKGQLLGTLPYMSPEQISGDLREVDIRSDIYALGVICYRVLAGRLPISLGNTSIAEAARQVTERDPERLGSIDRRYRGDIETIVAKALEKNRERRYQSALELREDLLRYLRHEAISARPTSTWYQIRKFSKRNKGLVGGGVIAVTALVIALISMGLSLSRTLKAESETRAEADKADAINEFLDDMLSSVDPSHGPGQEVTVRAMLDASAERLEESFAEQPGVKAALHDTIGVTYRNIGLHEKALMHLERSLSLGGTLLGGESEESVETMNHLAGLYWRLDRSEEAEALIRRGLEIRRRLHGERDEKTLELVNNLSVLCRMRGDLAQAESLLRTVLKHRPNAADGRLNPLNLTTMNNLASLLEDQHKVDEAEQIYRQVLEARRRSLGNLHPKTLISIHNLATMLMSVDQAEEAEERAREAVRGYTATFDENHPDTLRAVDNLVSILEHAGNFDQAEILSRDLIERTIQVLGPTHRDTLRAREGLASILAGSREFAEAESIYRDLIASYREQMGPAHPRTLAPTFNLAELLATQGDREGASPLYEQVIRLAEESLPAKHRYNTLFRQSYAEQQALWSHSVDRSDE